MDHSVKNGDFIEKASDSSVDPNEEDMMTQRCRERIARTHNLKIILRKSHC
jgi:hypothetical protein